MQAVARIIGLCIGEPADGFIDMFRIDQRAVTSQLHDHVGTFRGIQQALRDVLDRATVDAAIDAPTKIRNNLIRPTDRARHDNIVMSFARRTRSTNRCNIGAPANGNITFPGSRVAAIRASMVAMIRILMTKISDARMLA